MRAGSERRPGRTLGPGVESSAAGRWDEGGLEGRSGGEAWGEDWRGGLEGRSGGTGGEAWWGLEDLTLPSCSSHGASECPGSQVTRWQ